MKIPLDRLPAFGYLPVTLPDGTEVVVVVSPSGISVLRDECPHQGLPLSAGTLSPDGDVDCPFHGARFSATTGRCLRGPAMGDVPRYEVAIAEGALHIGQQLAPG